MGETGARWAGWLPLAAAGAMAWLCVREINDLDFGFYLAAGREMLRAGGIPPREFLVPALPDQPFSGLWVLAAPLFALAWGAAGPAGLVAMKAVCYGGGFLAAGWGAARAARSPEAAWPLAIAAAACVAHRFVERPGMFSALLLGAVVAAGEHWRGSPRRGALWALPPLFAVWSMLHAEWYLGWIAAAGMAFDAARMDRGMRAAAAGAMAASLALPFAIFAAIHPAGVAPLLAPFAVVAGGAADFAIKEYSLASWTVPSAALAVLCAAAAVCALRERPGAACAALAMAAVCFKVPRGVLPLALAGLPLLAAAMPRVQGRGASAALLAGALALAGGMGARLAGRPPGWGVAASLDTRGVEAVLAAIPEREGPIMAEYGRASLLLAGAGAARQGVVMDGRQEAYPRGYFEEMYVPFFAPGRAGETAARNGAAFYYHAYTSAAHDAAPELRAAGWRVVAWDNSGRLMARGDVAERRGLRGLAADPIAVQALAKAPPDTVRAAIAEIDGELSRLAALGAPRGRGLVARAYLELALGEPDRAAATLDAARTEGAEQQRNYWQVRASAELLRGNDAAAAEAARRAEGFE